VLVRVAKEFGLEGLVAKRKTSVYESGRRSAVWVNSRSPRARNSLSAATHSLKVPAATLDPFWSATTVRMGLGSPGESAPVFRTRSCRTSTPSSRT
jgi:hypothetical protein